MPKPSERDARVIVRRDERRKRLQYSVHIDGAVLCGGAGNRYFGTAEAAAAAGDKRVRQMEARKK